MRLSSCDIFLMYCVVSSDEYDYYSTTKSLLDHGTDVNAVDDQGLTAMDHALNYPVNDDVTFATINSDVVSSTLNNIAMLLRARVELAQHFCYLTGYGS